MAKGTTEMEVGSDGVAVIYIANPPVNALSIDVLFSLKGHYEEVLRRNDVKAIVLTGSGRSFSAGLDISAFADIRKHAGKPSVAAIDGPALGGGLEISMVCQARISTPNAQLGLTELQFGVIPGFGGTQRLPRLVGLTKALEMMMLSKPIKAEEAHELGLVDAVVSPNDLLNNARRWALDIYESKRPWARALYKTDKLESPDLAREILNSARVQSRKRAANLQYPFVCIDAVEEGIVSGPQAGLRKEAMAFQELFFSDTCKSLIHVFFSQRATSKQVPGITDLGLMPRKVSNVAIVGGGLMGSGIATALILSHYPVILKEVNEEFLNAGIDRIKENLQSRVRKGKMTKEKYDKTLSLLTGVLDYEKFKSVDLAIEASSISNYLTSAASSKECPAHIMPLLEIVHTPRASLQAVVTLLDVGKKIKKTPIVVRNCTGFAVNRMFFPYTQAALWLVDHGMDVYKIDQACTEFGMPIGPFRMTDLVGFGVALATGMQHLENFPERVYKSMLISLMTEDKRTGEASQKGFYRYDSKRKASPDPEIMNYLEESRRIAGATPDPELLKLDNSAIAEMVLFPVINEACRVLGEGIAFKASDLDIASIFGMDFPPYRGGIMHWADSIGARRICTMLSEWEMKYGQFFKPCSHLLERAAEGLPLSALATKTMNNQAKDKL
ncbi:Glyoxysomal fatty acid beta-oxidation multifunctional protein MFP-a [Triticum urartu]|uniref:Glyoxysomal fatty acid beta-oxidation multifunctional protein MFP-a n=1 Tax=Triticum urartu TaxID=4572 RepID=M8A1T3_TRIUA|nr:Glyoxysomal fatty acid beta-oxidation multifunctional protein MFP-a [Triticum urartu]